MNEVGSMKGKEVKEGKSKEEMRKSRKKGKRLREEFRMRIFEKMRVS